MASSSAMDWRSLPRWASLSCSSLASRSLDAGPGTKATALSSAFSSARRLCLLLRVSGAKHGFP